MRYNRIEEKVDLNDPEGEFHFTYMGDLLTLSIIDWRAIKLQFKFENTFMFKHMLKSGYKGLPEAEVLEIIDSEDIEVLLEEKTAGKDDNLRHFIISTNEDEWCEVIASGYVLESQS